jgi:hypothetical protein
MTVPNYLLNNPFPYTKWKREQKPIAVVDGAVVELTKRVDEIQGKVAYVVGLNQKTFDKIAPLFSVKAINFYEMRVADLSALRPECIFELAIHWNTKLKNLSPIGLMSQLKTLVIEDTPKTSDLSFLSELNSLRILAYGGGIWNKNTADSLEPIGTLQTLQCLHLSNLKIKDGGLRPIAKLPNLSELVLSNQFPTEDYAYLKAMLPGLKCDMLEPYVELGQPIDGKDVMVIGSRKPFLNSKTDKDMLEKYRKTFNRLVRKFAANKEVHQMR